MEVVATQRGPDGLKTNQYGAPRLEHAAHLTKNTVGMEKMLKSQRLMIKSKLSEGKPILSAFMRSRAPTPLADRTITSAEHPRPIPQYSGNAQLKRALQCNSMWGGSHVQ